MEGGSYGLYIRGCRAMNKKKWIKRLLITLAVLLCGFAIFEIIVHVLMDSEMSSRDDWNIQLGERMYTSEERGVSLYSAPCEASIPVSRMVPDEYEEDGFTYYDESVQHRLGQELMELVQQQGNAAIDAPLALLNPFGTGSNGLLLAFQTDRKSEIRYTIHTTSAELPDYTATAQGLGDKQFSRKHCFLLVGLVPGETQEVTLEAIGEWGKVQERATFTIEMPPSSSGYDSRLTYTDGDSAAALSDGLFYATGLGDYYG